MSNVYLLWAQYSDRSGEAFLGVYEDEVRAECDKDLIELAQPGMTIRVVPVRFTPRAG